MAIAVFTAVVNDDYFYVQELLRHGASAQYTNIHQQNLLHLAAERGSSQMVEILLPFEHVNSRDANGNTPLHLCCKSNLGKVSKMVHLLITSGAAVNAKNNLGETPLICAARHERDNTVECMQALLESGADKEIKDKSRLKAVKLAKSKQTLELLQAKPTIKTVGVEANISHAHPKAVVKRLSSLSVALRDAIKSGDLFLVQYLVFLGADVNSSDYGKNCLLLACEMGLVDIVDWLRSSVFINNKDAVGNSVLHLCQWSPSAGYLTKSLLESCPAFDTGESNNYNQTALMIAIEQLNIESALHLLKKSTQQLDSKKKSKQKKSNPKGLKRFDKNDENLLKLDGLVGLVPSLRAFYSQTTTPISEAMINFHDNFTDILLATKLFDVSKSLMSYVKNQKNNSRRDDAVVSQNVSRLLDKGADIFYSNDPPIFHVLHNGDFKLLELMVKKVSLPQDVITHCKKFHEGILFNAALGSLKVIQCLEPILKTVCSHFSLFEPKFEKLKRDLLKDPFYKALSGGHIKYAEFLLPFQTRFNLLGAINIFLTRILPIEFSVTMFLKKSEKGVSLDLASLKKNENDFLSMLINHQPERRIFSAEVLDNALVTAVKRGDDKLLKTLLDIDPKWIGPADVYKHALEMAALKNRDVIEMFTQQIVYFSTQPLHLDLTETLMIGLKHCDEEYVLKLLNHIWGFDMKEALSQYFTKKLDIGYKHWYVDSHVTIQSEGGLSQQEMTVVTSLLLKGRKKPYNNTEFPDVAIKSPIILAIALGDLNLLNILLDKIPHDCLGNATMYSMAAKIIARHERLDIFEILAPIFSTIKFTKKSKNNLNPALEIALSKSDLGCVDFLLKIMKRFDLHSALCAAIRTGNEAVFQAVKRRHCELCGGQVFDKLVKTRLGTEWLYKASLGNNLNIVNSLISCGAPPNDPDLRFKQPLSVCVSVEIAQALLQHGADVAWEYQGKASALQNAVQDLDQNSELVETLVKAGAPVTVDIVIDMLMNPRSLKSVHAIVLNCDGYNPTCGGKKGFYPLCMAANRGFKEAVEILVSKGADVNVRPELVPGCSEVSVNGLVISLSYSCPPLIEAIKGDHIDIVRFLLDKGADVDITSSDGQSAVIMAARRGNAVAIKLLSDKGADLNVCDKLGRSALSESLSHFNYDCFEALLDANADTEVKLNGKTLLETYLNKACNVHGGLQSKYLIKLMKKGGKIPCSEDWNLLVHSCLISSQFDLLSSLICDGGLSPVVMRDEPGGILSPFCLALVCGREQIARNMLEAFYLVPSDIHEAPNNEILKRLIEQNTNQESKDKCLGVLNQISSSPPSLNLLSFVKVSQLVGPFPHRKQRLAQTGLPPGLQTRLMFSHANQQMTDKTCEPHSLRSTLMHLGIYDDNVGLFSDDDSDSDRYDHSLDSFEDYLDYFHPDNSDYEEDVMSFMIENALSSYIF